MAPVSERRFDPNFAAQILLDIANEQSLEMLLEKLVERVLERPHLVCVQIWLTGPGDLCPTCPRRSECPDQSQCLHLAVAKGKSIAPPGKGFGRLDARLSREPLGVPPIGSVVVSGQQHAVADLNKQPASPLDPDWMREEGIQGYAINPISYKGEALGAIVTATREPFQEELLPWGCILANQIGAAIANARAFEEIRLTNERLAQANQSLARELAERKEAEEKLRKSERKYHELVEHANSIILHWHRDGRIIYLNEFGQRFFGYTETEICGRHLIGTLVPETESQGRNLQQLLEEIGANPSAFEQNVNENVRRNGERVWIAWTNKVALNANGEVTEILSIGVDITERKRAEEELRKHREHLEELVKERTEQLAVFNQLVFGSLESGEVGAWWIDFKEPDTVHALDNTVRMVGIEPDPTGQRAYQRSNWDKKLADTAAAFPDYAPLIDQARERQAGAISGKYENFRAVHPLVMADGSLKWIDGRGEIARRDQNGQALLMTGTVIDVTRLKQAEADLEEAKARAEAANREKSRFLANMSHELRTPLNAVLGFSRLLKSGPDVTPHQKEVLDIIVRSGEHLLNLINNVLDMAKIESGRVSVENSEIDLHQLLHEMQSLMGAGAAAKGLQFSLEPASDLPRFVAVDAGKLRQVLLNLLGNAIKYTDSGGVILRARLVGSTQCRVQSAECGERAELRFEVEDSGLGISQLDCQRVFLPFVQVGSQAAAQAGTGLGLAICKQYVELMGGQIGVTSEPGKGSVFHFEVPVSVLPSVMESEQPKHGRVLGLAEGQPHYRILIVEDQPENRLLLRRLLEPLGFELREAVNGQEAVSLFDQWRPDLIWMDIRMPVMDGLEAVRWIRASQAGGQTKIVALTAHALEEERRPAMAAGCDDFVRKPFREQEIFDALARHLRLKFIYEEAPRRDRSPGSTLRPQQLDALPAELLQDLRQAVIELDTARTQTLIGQVTERDASLGQTLNRLATQLDYKALLKLLQKGHSETGEMV